VTFIDPAPAIARRVVDLGGPQQSARAPSPARMVFTSGREPSSVLAAALARFGIAY
jgi:glutamate racemase